MANIHMVREHPLGLAGARKAAQGWARQVEDRLEMSCTFETRPDGDNVRFERTGVSGTLRVSKDRFELDARLGLVLGAFKGRIEAEITKYLDEMLATGQDPLNKPAGGEGRAG